MKKMLSTILCFTFLNAQIITASSWASISPKRIKNAIAITSGILSIPCFKKCYDLSVEHNSLLQSVLPNFEELFEKECNQQSFFAHSSTYTHLWNKFLKTQLEPTHPEIIPKLDTLYTKAGLFFVAGIVLTAVTLMYAFDNSIPNKTTMPTEVN